MRFYGIRSGRNNMSRYIARSIIKNSNIGKRKNDLLYESGFDFLTIIIIICVVVAVIGLIVR